MKKGHSELEEGRYEVSAKEVMQNMEFTTSNFIIMVLQMNSLSSAMHFKHIYALVKTCRYFGKLVSQNSEFDLRLLLLK